MAAKLRRSVVGASAGAVEEVAHIVAPTKRISRRSDDPKAANASALRKFTSAAKWMKQMGAWPGLSEEAARWLLGGSEALLIVSAVVLALGIVGEWPESERWKRRIWYRAAKATVLIGVIGEVIGDGGIFEASARLQAAQDATIQTARTAAADANERAGMLEKQAAQLQRDNLMMQKQAADAQKAAADAQAEEKGLQAKVIWRRLTPGGCRALVNALPQPPGAVAISYPFGDPEAVLFAITLGNCFGLVAHWAVSTGALGFKDALPIGLTITGRDPMKLQAVKEGLSAGGLAFGTDASRIEQGVIARFGVAEGAADVAIIVGSRPVFP